jgi:hypothetical protein
MTLIAWNGTGPILKNGSIGTEQECCCGDGPPTVTNCCSGAAITVARSLNVTLTLGSQISTFDPTPCGRAAAEALINGTYSVPYSFSGADYAAYTTVLSSGMTLTIGWYCSGFFIFGTKVSMVVEIRFCDTAQPCLDRANYDFWFDAPGYSSFGSSSPSLCSITQGDTTAWTGASNNPSNDPITIAGNLVTCSQNAGFQFDRYNLTIDVTPSW